MSTTMNEAPAPLIRDSPRRRGGAARVSTLRLCTGSEWTSSSSDPAANWAAMRSTRPRSRPSDTLGAASSTRSDEELAGAHQCPAVELEGGLDDDAVDVDRDLNGPADPRRRTEGDVDGAQDLLRLDQVVAQGGLLVGPDTE